MKLEGASTQHSHSMSSVTRQDFGRFLQRLRRRNGLSQDQFAGLMACHRTYIWRLEHCLRYPSAVFLNQFAEVVPLTPREVELLDAFAYLREYQCNTCAVESATILASPHKG
jgi:transcriptional regulator with XRE-family HTH domain